MSSGSLHEQLLKWRARKRPSPQGDPSQESNQKTTSPPKDDKALKPNPSSVLASKIRDIWKKGHISDAVTQAPSISEKTIRKETWDPYDSSICDVADKRQIPLAFGAEEHNLFRKIVNKRNIQALYHFTPVVNISGILELGLLPRSELESGPKKYMPMFNDEERWDRCKNASCCTIGFPNYRTFNRYFPDGIRIGANRRQTPPPMKGNSLCSHPTVPI